MLCNPVIFSAIPLPHVVLDTGPDDNIDHVYRERQVRYSDIPHMYPKANIHYNVRFKAAQTSVPRFLKLFAEITQSKMKMAFCFMQLRSEQKK
jgi:hypothetical protein